MNYVIYDENGKILAAVETPEPISAGQLKPILIAHQNSRWIKTDDPVDVELDFVEGRKVRRRPKMPAKANRTVVPADAMTPVEISKIPPAATLQVENQQATVNEGRVELTFDMPGKYRVTLKKFPFLDADQEIEAV